MISGISTRVQNYPYIGQHSKNQNYQVEKALKLNRDTITFTGEKKYNLDSFISTPSKKALEVLKRIKSRIPHNVIVISGPSGVGKDTIIAELKKKNSGLKTVVSYTTRAMRQGEAEGVDYRYIDHKTFEEMDQRGEFFQQLKLNGNRYGGTTADIHSQRVGEDVIINISSETAPAIKNKYGKKSVLLFIKAPSMEEIKRRLIKRGSDSAEVIETRLEYGRQQLIHTAAFDKIIMNDKLDVAADEAFKYINKRHSKLIKVVNSMINFLSKRIK